ncbi:MAG TPA: RHS repeat-associated core domain-containing protein [Longimicrobium sp.]|jgi:RHS repeat-associated protein
MQHLTRYVWDGDQVLYEVRSPDESDHPTDSPSSAAYGRAGYTHGGVIDAPLDLIRMGHAGDTATVVVPHRTALGRHDRGARIAGPDVAINWPGAHWNAFRKPMDPSPKPGGWAGSLITGSADQSGLQYMRNRYYDPRTGQFTQQDPIGLAGGLNTYGFADGDPVTTPHHAATQAQRRAGGGTYGAERRIGYRALRTAGLSADEARANIVRADHYFNSLGVQTSTPTRIPGNRPR